MKLTNVLKTLVTATAVALTLLGSYAHADNIPGIAEQPATYFYTGKPYDNDLGAYTFAARNYNPAINRWTTPDPSGFPDGVNNNIYAPTPTMQFDPTGFSKMTSYRGTINWYDGKPRPETFTETFNDYYSDVNYKPIDFNGFSSAFAAADDGDNISLVRNYNHGDTYAIGRGNYHLDGTVHLNGQGDKVFSGAVTLENDTFDFNPDPSRTWYNNALTWLLANTAFNPALGGASFDLTFSGSKNVMYE
jgi:RHS repeat-associated protein